VTPPFVSDPFWGSIDEVRISDIVRYQDDYVFHFDECSGNTVSDVQNQVMLSLNAHAAWTTSGARNCGLDLRVGQAGTNPGNNLLGNGWDKLLVEARVKLLTPEATATPVVSRYDLYTTDGFYLLAGREGDHYGSLEGSVSTGPGLQRVFAVSPDGTINDTCWHVIAMTFDKDDSLKLWIDGQRVAASQSDGNPMIASIDPLRFGSNALMGYPGPFNGYIDEVRIARANQLTPLCPPLPPIDVVLQTQGSNAYVTWSPVTQDSCGIALCPDLYLVFFESHYSEDPDFLAYTTETNYTPWRGSV